MTGENASAAPLRGGIAILLRLEALVAFAAGLAGYFTLYDGWLLLLVLALLPDLSMIGYAFGARAGARAYNLAHTYLAPAALALAGLALGQTEVLAAACVWVAHIGMDRALGYGLKYDSFGQTHLGAIGR